jgi:hypothetical protein
VEDLDEVSPQFSYLLLFSHRLSLFILVCYRVSTFSIERFRHALVARIRGLRSKNTLEWHSCNTRDEFTNREPVG